MSKKTYEESDALKKAQQALAQQTAAKPAPYQSQWQQQLDALLDQILNREEFGYDAAEDPLYRHYRDSYQSQGRLAMEDTLGQAQAMTGGYGNSYAQSVGQQTYQNYLQSLNSRIPELYQLALSRYESQGAALGSQLQLLQGREDADYSRWQDAYAQWESQRDHLADRYAAQQQQEQDRYLADRDFAFRQEQAALEQSRWQAEFDQALRKYEQELAARQPQSGGGSYAGNGGVDAATVRRAQAFVGAEADGMWGKRSKAAAKALGYSSLQEVIAAMDAVPAAPAVPSRIPRPGTAANPLYSRL